MGSRLPPSGAPLTLANGVVLEPSVPPVKPQTRISVPSATEAQRIVSSTRRKLADLPAVPKQMNAVAAILMYTACGLSDDEIMVATGITASQLTAMRDSPAYREVESHIIGAVHEAASTDVKRVLAKAEVVAAERLVKFVDDMDPRIALAATRDILDRQGHTAATKIDIRQQMASTLRIEVVDKRDNNAPIIDMEVAP